MSRPLRRTALAGALGALLAAAVLGPVAPASAAPAKLIGGWPFRCGGPAPKTPIGKGREKDSPGKRESCRSITRLAPLDPAQSASGYNPAFGLNEDWHFHVPGIALLPELGASTSRVGIRWDYVEGTRGRYDWSQYDQVIGAMYDRGIAPMLTIEGSPCWARPGSSCVRDSHHPPYKKYMPAFAKFVGQAVRRYRSITGVEIWNEPNLSEFWWPRPQPKLYTRMLRLSYKQVKKANRHIPVIFAGLVPQFSPDPTGERMDARAFQTQAYKAGAGRWTDGFGVHPYVFPHSSPILLIGVRAQLAIPKAIAARFGYPTTPLWVTEFGLSSSADQGLGVDGQATRLGELYSTLRAIPGVPVVILHRLYDIDPLAAGYQADMGLIDVNGTRKPAFCAIAAARNHPCATLGS